MSVTGTWNLWFAWQNTLPYDDKGSLIFQNNGIVEAQYTGFPSEFGRWAEEAGIVIIYLEKGSLGPAVFTGNVALDSITGVMSMFQGLNEFNGSWYAVRNNTIKPANVAKPTAETEKLHSPILGPSKDNS